MELVSYMLPCLHALIFESYVDPKVIAVGHSE